MLPQVGRHSYAQRLPNNAQPRQQVAQRAGPACMAVFSRRCRCCMLSCRCPIRLHPWLHCPRHCCRWLRCHCCCTGRLRTALLPSQQQHDGCRLAGVQHEPWAVQERMLLHEAGQGAWIIRPAGRVAWIVRTSRKVAWIIRPAEPSLVAGCLSDPGDVLFCGERLLGWLQKCEANLAG